MVKEVLASREDSCKALFVTDTLPTKRMAIPTIRWAIKRLADRGELEGNVYRIAFDILMHVNSLIMVLHWISFRECSVMRRHRPLKSMHNSEANVGENFIDDTFSLQ